MRLPIAFVFLLVTSSVAPAASPDAGKCRANAPEGYKWLSSYVDEFNKSGKAPDWFADSLKKHPNDYALVALDSYFKAGADWDKGFATHSANGGNAKDYADGLACANVSP